MKKKSKQEKEGFDERFDSGKESIDFSSGIVTEGLSKTLKRRASLFSPTNQLKPSRRLIKGINIS